MELSALKLRPQLIEITIADEDIVQQFGEAVTFYMKDHLDIQTYFDFYKHQSDANFNELASLAKTILMNKDGKPVLNKTETLPIILMSRIIGAIGDQMAKTSTIEKKAESAQPAKE